MFDLYKYNVRDKQGGPPFCKYQICIPSAFQISNTSFRPSYGVQMVLLANVVMVPLFRSHMTA